MIDTAKIVAARKANPCLTLEAVGERFGCTREYVRQILKGKGEKTRHLITHKHCIACGNQMGNACVSFCSRKCQYAYVRIPIACKECGVIFRVRASYLISRRKHGKDANFCSNKCKGIWIGKTFGFTVHPENCGRHRNA